MQRIEESVGHSCNELVRNEKLVSTLGVGTAEYADLIEHICVAYPTVDAALELNERCPRQVMLLEDREALEVVFKGVVPEPDLLLKSQTEEAGDVEVLLVRHKTSLASLCENHTLYLG